MTTTRRRLLLPLAALALGAVLAPPFSSPAAAAPRSATVVLAGGCFWGMEAVFGALAGVTEAMPGYAGGSAATAHYDLVSTGTTGHAESVRVTYDPAKISFRELLAVFFTVAHDPTERNRQGPDEGTQYRSVIFVTNDRQRSEAEKTIARLTAEHRFAAPIVTQVVTLHGFYPAEAYHRHYVARHPDDPYVVINDLPKLAALRKTFPRLVAQR